MTDDERVTEYERGILTAAEREGSSWAPRGAAQHTAVRRLTARGLMRYVGLGRVEGSGLRHIYAITASGRRMLEPVR